MNIQNIHPDQDNTNGRQQEASPSTQKDNDKTGLDEWNDRLDNNLETEHNGDELADENARTYSSETGSGDQSDEPLTSGNDHDEE